METVRRRVRRCWRRWVLACAVPALLLAMGGCRTQEDALAAAEQMSATAATMERYFATLDGLSQGTEGVQRAQQYLSGVPLDDATLVLIRDNRAEMRKRARLAHTLAQISADFAEIANSDAANDAAKAAGALQDELVGIKAVPASTAAANALRVVVTSLVNVLRAHDEVKAARLLQPLLQALCGFFDAEKGLYVSVADSYYVTAASNASALIAGNQVALGGRFQSSLAPFGLEPDVTLEPVRTRARADLERAVQDGLAEHRRENADAAAALSEALHRMQSRVATVAEHRALRVQLPPPTLEGVKAWIAMVQAETGVRL